MTEKIAAKPEDATPTDLPQLAELLAESLFDDPLQQWLFPAPERRLAMSKRMFRRLLKPGIARRLVRVIRDGSGDAASVAVWTSPHPPAPSRWEHRAESLFMRWTFGKRIHEVRAGFTALASRHPPQPHWYLLALATGSAHRGHGHAKCLLDQKIRECESSGELIALETSNRENLTYYQRYGFEVEDELQLKPGLPVWLMCRTAQK